MAYVIARHAPGGLLYLTVDGGWVRTRCDAEPFDTRAEASDVATTWPATRHLPAAHVRNAWRHALTCRPVGRPRLAF